MYIKFLDSESAIKCSVKKIAQNVVELKFADEIIINTSGFNAYLDKNCEHDIGGDFYNAFTTIYRNDETTNANNGYQLSSDGSVYTPIIPTTNFTASNGGTLDGTTTQQVTMYENLKIPTPISNENYIFDKWVPEIPTEGKIASNQTFNANFIYVPTLEEVQEEKVAEMNATQQEIIKSGIEVTLTDGTVERFSLSDHDQTSLMGLQTQVIAGVEQIPWHEDDETEHCKYYSNADMAIITQTALNYVSYHVTYFRDLRIYIRALEDKETVNAIYYGISIPEEYQSEPLKDMLAQLS